MAMLFMISVGIFIDPSKFILLLLKSNNTFSRKMLHCIMRKHIENETDNDNKHVLHAHLPGQRSCVRGTPVIRLTIYSKFKIAHYILKG